MSREGDAIYKRGDAWRLDFTAQAARELRDEKPWEDET
jgi:hypothetical protein